MIFASHEEHILETLVVLVLLMVILHYSNSFLISFRALPSTDLTECSSPLLALPGHHSCVVTALSYFNFLSVIFAFVLFKLFTQLQITHC